MIHSPLTRRSLAALIAAPLLGRAVRAADIPLRIGVLTDETGPYADSGGPGSVLAAQMAAADFGGHVLGRPIEILHADHQNKPDIAAAIAGHWYDEGGVDAIIDLPVTAIALAVQQAAKTRQKTVMITAAATSDLTAKFCMPVSTHWADDTHALTAGTAQAVLAGGAKSWFFITVDHAFGRAMQRDASAVIEAGGGKVLGAARHPIGESDFAPFLLQARASGATAIGLASVGGDLVNLIKQAREFGLLQTGGPVMVGFLTYITDINALGLPLTQGLTFSAGFYWDQSESARRFGERFMRARRAMPTKNQAAIYTATLHYLRACAAAQSAAALSANRAMRALPIDYFGHPARIRDDGRVIYDLILYRVKTPAASHAPWDYYEKLANIAGDSAFLPENPACKG